MNDELRGYLLGCSDMAEEQGDYATASCLRWLAEGPVSEGQSVSLQIMLASDAQIRRLYVPGVRTSTGEVLRSTGFKRIERSRGTDALLTLVFEDIVIPYPHEPVTVISSVLLSRDGRNLLESPLGQQPTLYSNETLRCRHTIRFLA